MMYREVTEELSRGDGRGAEDREALGSVARRQVAGNRVRSSRASRMSMAPKAAKRQIKDLHASGVHAFSR